MGRQLIFLVLTILVGIISAQADQSKDTARIDALMKAYNSNGQFDGVVLVAKQGQVIYKQALGLADRDWDIPMTIDAKFRIASLSKAFTACLILQLVQDGLISLDGTISEYIPDYNGRGKDRITIHHLLTHTSGVLESLPPEVEVVKERLHHELRDLIRYAEEADLYAEPGTAFHYSNFGYNILAYIAERVTGRPFDALLQERIFEPLGMNDTKQYVDTQVEERLARGYEYKLLNGYENATYYDNAHTVGCGGLISTAGDLYLWHRALFSDQLLPGELKKKMYEPTEHGQYGYGWGIRRKVPAGSPDTLDIVEHSGSVNGFGSYIAQILQDTSLVVVLKNSREDTYISPAFAPGIGDQIISILYGEDVPLPTASIGRHVALYLGQYGFDRAREEYYDLKKRDFEHFSFDESELNKLGIELLFRFNRVDDAASVFEINMTEFPRSYNTYDSYAYALMQKQDYKSAIKYYREGLKILKKYPKENAGEQVQKDAQQARQYIKEMEGKLK